MRISVVSKGLTAAQLQAQVQQLGGRNVKVASRSKQVFCDVDDTGITRLSAVPGLAVKKLGKIRPAITPPAAGIQEITPFSNIYGVSQIAISSRLYEIRELTTPPTTGKGLTIIVMDSGVRKTHVGLVGKVVLEENFSSSPSVNDVFSHGTGVAFVIAGGRHVLGQEAGMIPDASLMNLKVIGDNGEGTVEDAILAIEYAMEIKRDAVDRGLGYLDPMNPQVVNISWGTEDDGDDDHPLRVALREASTPGPYGLAIVAAAGNNGPNPGTILLPASMPEVLAVGAVTFSPFSVWAYSSRGPAPGGVIKPDVVFFGVEVITADSRDDEAFGRRSGTSFSAPAGAGGGAGVLMLLRNLGVLTDEQAFTAQDIEQYGEVIRSVCVKPDGVLAGKDNDYGYGIPYGGTILGGAGTYGNVLNMVLPLMTMGMMIPFIGKMAK